MARRSLSRWLWPPAASMVRPSAAASAASSSVSSAKIAVSNRKSSSRRKSGVISDDFIDQEFGGVLVPEDGVYMSDSDSGDSDWSIGWFEPMFSSPFSSCDNGYAALLPRRSLKEPHNKNEIVNEDPINTHLLLNALLSDTPSQDRDEHIKKWLDSLK